MLVGLEIQDKYFCTVTKDEIFRIRWLFWDTHPITLREAQRASQYPSGILRMTSQTAKEQMGFRLRRVNRLRLRHYLGDSCVGPLAFARLALLGTLQTVNRVLPSRNSLQFTPLIDHDYEA